MIYFNNFNKNEVFILENVLKYYDNIDKKNIISNNRLKQNINNRTLLSKDDFYTIVLMLSSYIYLYKDIEDYDENNLNHISNLLLKFIFLYKDHYFTKISEIDKYVLYNLKISFDKYIDILNIENTYKPIISQILK